MALMSTAAQGVAGLGWYAVVLAIAAYLTSAYRQAVASKQTNIEFARVCEKYGSVARIAPDTLITSSPELMFRMNAVRSLWTKGYWYAGLRIPPGQDNLFSLIDEKKHKIRRAQMADGYSGKTNLSLESAVDAHVLNLIKLIRSKYMSTNAVFKPMDMARKATFFTMDVITDIAFAKPFGNLTNDEDMYKYIQSTEEMLPLMLMMTSIPALSAFLQIGWVSKLLFPSDKDNTGVGKIISIARRSIQERLKSNNVDRRDMTASLIAHGLSETDLTAESILQILAGADTSATAFRATLLHIITHPFIYHTLQAEIDTSVYEGRISSPVIKEFEALAMPYLQAVIREGLRIWPPVKGLLSKVAPQGGDEVEVDGKKMFIPGGTNVGICAWGLHRDKDIFGPDADVFRPERWLIEDGDKLSRMHKAADLVFGNGKYMCLGRPVAMLELNKIFVELLRRFDFELVDSTKPWKSTNVGLFIQSELFVRITDRKIPAAA